ncbi:MlaD family protein [Pseudoalteromonas umbrosa]|uniref:MlaD family protein n=1 Tax=Pseudoalteromonas umbrosa TaxID=3048489 RepID=UPI0024C4495E|nr:MlaD family protein [Pseudoalteromonas sp. B95]MDK1286720.1 MlaD family protein [Pseudoalteromonas sp. B95]
MQHSVNKTNNIVLVFGIAGILMLLTLTSMILVNNHTFADKTYYKTVLQDASGLSALPAIYFKGLKVGRIDGFRLNHDTNLIEVDLWIFQEYQSKVVEYAVLAGEQHPIFDDVTTFELILPNKKHVDSYVQLAPNSFIPHINSELGKSYVEQGAIAQKGDDIESILASINQLLQNFQKEDNPEAGAIFRVLDRVAKISDNLMVVSEEVRSSDLLPDAERTLAQSQQVLEQMPKVLAQINTTLLTTERLMGQAGTTLSNYAYPAQIVGDITEGQLPIVLNNLNESLTVMQTMLKEVHSEREQFAIAIHSMQQVLDKMDKTLQALNNHPILKDGIEKQPQTTGIEMHD